MGWDGFSRRNESGVVQSHLEVLQEELGTPDVELVWLRPGAGYAYAAVPRPDGQVEAVVALVEDERSGNWGIPSEPDCIWIKDLPPDEVVGWPDRISRLITVW